MRRWQRIAAAILVVVVVASGSLADRFGRKPLLLLATLLGFIGALPLFFSAPSFLG